MTPSELKQLRLLSELAHCNPFSPERIQHERQLLGKSFVEDDARAWSRNIGKDTTERPNVLRLSELANRLAERFCQTTADNERSDKELMNQYWDVVTYALLYRRIVPLKPGQLFNTTEIAGVWESFRDDYRRLSNVSGLKAIRIQSAAHLFALVCQVHRAFHNIFQYILGDSTASVRLRASVWQSVFTCDLRRYRETLYDRMGQITSLITGPSGTGKELVARAIGMSQYVPFETRRLKFCGDDESRFFPLNLAALSPTLIESELFGHRKGSFTGAVADHRGWLEQCPPSGAVFLDEIGELSQDLQVKLLRLVQQRNFTRIGDTAEKTFRGKIVGATNRNLEQEMERGTFREDFYYRLCADRIETPTLREQLDERPDDLYSFCLYVAWRMTGGEGRTLAEQATAWILENLGPDYPWRGNIRELEQCVAGIMIRGSYRPAESACATASDSAPRWIHQTLRGELSADQLLQKYSTLVYHRCGTYEVAARTLKLDRRTVKAKIDHDLLRQLQQAGKKEN